MISITKANQTAEEGKTKEFLEKYDALCKEYDRTLVPQIVPQLVLIKLSELKKKDDKLSVGS